MPLGMVLIARCVLYPMVQPFLEKDERRGSCKNDALRSGHRYARCSPPVLSFMLVEEIVGMKMFMGCFAVAVKVFLNQIHS